MTSDAVQVHGGMGFIEDTGIAQHYRDARILPIYEGTTAIQANDLVFRKTIRDEGRCALALIDEIAGEMDSLGSHDDDVTRRGAAAVLRGCDDARKVWHICSQHQMIRVVRPPAG